MSDLRAAAKQALEALSESIDLVREEYASNWRHSLPSRAAQLETIKAGVEAHEAAIKALQEALAAPVAPAVPYELRNCSTCKYADRSENTDPCATCIDGMDAAKGWTHWTAAAPQPTPAAAPQAPLTDEQMWRIWNSQGVDSMNQQEAIAFARAIEAHHGIGAAREQ